MNRPLATSRLVEAGLDALRLADTRILVKIGDVSAEQVDGHPVHPLCRSLGAMGFGFVHVRGAAEYFPSLERAMEGCNFDQQPGIWLSESVAAASPECDLIVDLGNDPGAESFCGHLSSTRSARCTEVKWGQSWAAVGRPPVTGAEFDRWLQPLSASPEAIPPVHRIAAGLALSELLVMADQLALATPLQGAVLYDAAASDRSLGHADAAWECQWIENASLEVIGAGAVGVNLLESLAPMLGRGCQLRIFDPDRVGVENLVLQRPYSVADVGRPKAVVMAERLARLCGTELDIGPMVMGYQQRPRRLSRPSLRIVCGDNFAVRWHANEESIADGVPLVEAGSSPLAAQQRSYYPGLTACLAHRIPNLAGKVAAESRPESCSRNRALTLPGTNMLIGGILAAEALRALRPDRFGSPSRGTITYDCRVPERFGIVDLRAACQHEERAATPSANSSSGR